MLPNIPVCCGIYHANPIAIVFIFWCVASCFCFTFVDILAHFDICYIFQKESELLSGNDVLWTFVNFAGEDHTNFQTLVAFLNMLSTLVCKCIICFVKHALLYLCGLLHYGFSWLDVLCRLLVKKVLQRFMSYSRVKHSALLGGVHCLIAFQFMMRSLNSLFKLLGPFYLSSRKGMQKHLLHIWMFFRRFWPFSFLFNNIYDFNCLFFPGLLMFSWYALF